VRIVAQANFNGKPDVAHSVWISILAMKLGTWRCLLHSSLVLFARVEALKLANVGEELGLTERKAYSVRNGLVSRLFQHNSLQDYWVWDFVHHPVF
jgi:hypothetical protein